jgi:tRNA(adenine34) deaminase
MWCGATRERSPGRRIRSPAVDRAELDGWMSLALEEARAAPEHDDVPVGAAVVRLSDGEVLARRHNERERAADPTAHAEILAMRDASAKVGSWRLDGCALVVTLEPCPMCAGAAVASRMDAVVFGAADPKAGACGSLYNVAADPRLNHELQVVDGVRADESAALLRGFFAARRRASEL